VVWPRVFEKAKYSACPKPVIYKNKSRGDIIILNI